jgi:hypothetical protein
MGKEDSIPVTVRVGIRELAELDEYWMREGYQVRSMSQLVGWSCELLCSVLRANGKSMPLTIRDAHERLVKRQLYQKSNEKKAFMKTGAAMRFESMREEGVNPQEYAESQFNVVNRANSVQPAPEGVKPVGYVSPFEEDYKKAKKVEFEEARDKAIEAMRASNSLVGSENKASVNQTVWEAEKSEKDYLNRLNAPIDEQLEFMKKNVVKE